MLKTITPQHIILGKCTYVFYPRSRDARLEPLLLCAEGEWKEIDQATLTFPDVGTVFSAAPSTSQAEIGSFWTFTIEMSLRYEPGKGHDKFVARDPRPAIQVIDRSDDDLESVRRDFVETGLLDSQVLTQEVVICLAGDRCTRLKMVPGPLPGWRCAAPNGLDNVALMRRPPRVADGALISGAMFLLPGVEFREIVDRVDWSPDHDFLERTLKRVRKIVRENGRGGDALTISRDAIEELSRYLRRIGPVSGDADQLHRMQSRLESFFPRFEASVLDLDDIVSTLEAYRPVKDRIDFDIRARRSELDEELRRELEPVVREALVSRNADVTSELERLQSELAATELTRNELQQQVEMLGRSAGNLRIALASDLGTLYDAFEAAPSGAAETVNEVARRISKAIAESPLTGEVTPPATPPWGLGLPTRAERIERDRLRSRLHSEAASFGLVATDATCFDALLRAGELVVIVEQRDRSLCNAYARIVSGGRRRTFAVDPSIIGLDDLWRQPGSGAPTSFARAWTAARVHPNETVFLVIESMDAAPFRFWLPQLVAELHGADRPRNLLIAGVLSATGCSDTESLGVLRSNTVPLMLPPSSAGAWMRSALRVAGRNASDAVTYLDPLAAEALTEEETKHLLTSLTEIPTLDSCGASRAVRVMQSACATMDRSDALRLAIDVARIVNEVDNAASSIDTPSVARGVKRLHDLCNKK